jgi:hypothetical protein
MRTPFCELGGSADEVFPPTAEGAYGTLPRVLEAPSRQVVDGAETALRSVSPAS